MGLHLDEKVHFLRFINLLLNKMTIDSVFSSLTVLAEASASTGGGLSSLMVPALLFVGMWFLLIAPQRKKQKKHAQMIQQLNTGDEVLTAGGIYGTISNVKDDRFVIKVAEGTKVEITKSAVQAKAEAVK